MADDIGSYQVFHGGRAVRFWPLTPGTRLATAAPPAPAHPVRPGRPNVIVVANFGLVDVAVPLPPEASITRRAVANQGLTARVAGNGVLRAELFANQTGNANMAQLCFAVNAGHATNPYDAELRLTVDTPAGARRLDILLQVRPRAEENDLFIALALTSATQQYTWIRVRAVSQANASTHVGGASGVLRVLRDNSAVKEFNREYDVTTTKAGLVALRGAGLAGGTQARTVLGVPLNLPVAVDLTAAKFVRRVHLLELLPAQRTGHHNNNPFTPGNVTLIPLANASLAAHTFVLDAGHGVIYGHTKGIRVQEWFLSHRTARHVAHLLTTRHGVPRANITHMRTAGLALIDAHHFTPASAAGPTADNPAVWPSGNAVVLGDARYRYDLTARTLRTIGTAPTLTDVSNLLLTRHEAVSPFARLPVPDADRQRILAQNPATIAACIVRAVRGLRGRSAVAGSERWNAATQRYVFDTRPSGNPAGAVQTHNISINATDVWAVDNAALRILAERTARWSILREGLGTDQYSNQVRAAMIRNGAVRYMADACFEEADRPPGDPFLAHGIKGWDFNLRRSLIIALRPPPEITLTLHHNGLPRSTRPGPNDLEGFIMLASDATNATESHIRLQKTFVKYLTGLGAGLHGKGITQVNPNAMNGAQYARIIPGFAFFEVEFMDASSTDQASPPFPRDYERMAPDAFVQRHAEEIVAALVEFLLHPQPKAEFDPVSVGARIREGTVHW